MLQNISLKNLLDIKDLYKYGSNPNSYDIIKAAAIFFMIIDHIGAFLMPECEALRALGRIAFPLFFFLIGYSLDFKARYNLLILGIVISVFKALMINQPIPFDILITAFIVKIIMRLIKKDVLDNYFSLMFVMLMLVIWHFASFAVIQYGAMGILFAVCGYLKRMKAQNEALVNSSILFAMIFDYFYQMIIFSNQGGVFMPIFFVVSLGLILTMANFKMRDFRIENEMARNTVLFFSRNSLAIYTIHYLIFVYISGRLFPSLYVG